MFTDFVWYQISKLLLNYFRMTTLIHEKIWLDKNIYNDAEKNYYESLSKVSKLQYSNIQYIIHP